MIELRNQGITYQKIADKYGLSRQRIHQIITGYKSPTNIESKLRADAKSKMVLIKLNNLLREKLKLNIDLSDVKNLVQITGMESGSRDRNRELIRIRDNHTCQMCDKKWVEGTRRFDVHHLDEDKEKTRKADDLSKEAENMITLCHKCHLNLPGHRKSMSKPKK